MGHLKNLGTFATPNTTKTTCEKAQGTSQASTHLHTNKGNATLVRNSTGNLLLLVKVLTRELQKDTVPQRRSQRVKQFFKGLYTFGQKRRLKNRNETLLVDVSFDIDRHDASINDATAVMANRLYGLAESTMATGPYLRHS